MQITWSGGGTVSAVVPAGTWFLGDPYLAVPVGLWLPLLETCGFFKTQPVGNSGGYQVLAFRCRPWKASGKGTFHDQEGREYRSPSGLLGLTPVTMTSTPQALLAPVGRVVQWHAAHTCTNVAGLMRFGQYQIDTRE